MFFALCLIQTAVAATIIEYTAGYFAETDRWQYDYKIINNSTEALYGFAIYFDYGPNVDTNYSNLALEIGTASWDEIDTGFGVWQDDWMIMYGDPFAYNHGEISVLNLDMGLAAGEILEGLSISFDWFGDGTPGRQLFELFDADFASLDIFGYTTPPEVPEPQTFMLLGTGLLGLAAYYRRKIAGKAAKR